MRRLIIYGVATVLSLALVIATMVLVYRLVMAIYGNDVFHQHLKKDDVIWLVPPKDKR